MNNAKFPLTKWNGKYKNYYSSNGSVYLNIEEFNIRTAFTKNDFDDETKKVMELIKNEGI